MTSPIKPPGGTKPPGMDPTDAAGGADKARNADRAERFQEAMAPGTNETTSAEGAQDVATDVTQPLRAGEIDASQAVDRLVAAALESPMAQQLSPAGRADLEAHLRATLADDPNLSQMVEDLERA